MRDIFISKPTYIAPEFKKGLESFLTLIKTYDLNPRTLGVSDHPTESPLDEVIEILNQCVGVIILGYPQIIVKSGTLEGNSIDSKTPIILATEWNHIEAGIAYAKKLPLLVIHHTRVSRGIFDRGAFNKFLHEVDMSNNSWSSDESIIGAIAAWRKRLLEKPPIDSRSSTLDNDLEFDSRSGTLISKKNGLRYCHKCSKSSPPNPIELQESNAGWRCSVCGEFYRNPNWNPPQQQSPYDNDILNRGLKRKRNI